MRILILAFLIGAQCYFFIEIGLDVAHPRRDSVKPLARKPNPPSELADANDF
jgi:hypothetical protein